MAAFNLEDGDYGEFDESAEKLKYRTGFGKYWEERRIRVKKGIVYVSKFMADNKAKVHHYEMFVFTEYESGDTHGFIATSKTGADVVTYRFADTNMSAQFFASLQRKASVAPAPEQGDMHFKRAPNFDNLTPNFA